MTGSTWIALSFLLQAQRLSMKNAKLCESVFAKQHCHWKHIRSHLHVLFLAILFFITSWKCCALLYEISNPQHPTILFVHAGGPCVYVQRVIMIYGTWCPLFVIPHMVMEDSNFIQHIIIFIAVGHETHASVCSCFVHVADAQHLRFQTPT